MQANAAATIPIPEKEQISPLPTNRMVAAVAQPSQQSVRPVVSTNPNGMIVTGFYGEGFVKDSSPPISLPRLVPPEAVSNLVASVTNNALRKYEELTNSLSHTAVQITSWNKMYSGSYVLGTQSVKMLFFSPTGGLKQAGIVDPVTRRELVVFNPDRSGRLLLYGNSQVGEGARFYSNGTVQYVYRKGSNGIEHGASLSPDGYFVDWH